jgi:hypothetical protein
VEGAGIHRVLLLFLVEAVEGTTLTQRPV